MSQVRHWIHALFPDSPARDDLLLVTVELATNAVKFTGSGQPGGQFAIEITWLGRHVQVAVADGGAPEGPRLVEDPLAESGRGLLMVQELSTRFGVNGDHHGRLVWASLPWPGNAPGTSAPAAGHESRVPCGPVDPAGRSGTPLLAQNCGTLTPSAAPGDFLQDVVATGQPDRPGAVPAPSLAPGRPAGLRPEHTLAAQLASPAAYRASSGHQANGRSTAATPRASGPAGLAQARHHQDI